MLCRQSNLRKDYSYFTSDIALVLQTAGAQITISLNGKQQTVDTLTLMSLEGDVFVLSGYF